MKRIFLHVLILVSIGALLFSCTPAPTPPPTAIPPTTVPPTSTPIPPTATPEPTATATLPPAPTPMGGGGGSIVYASGPDGNNLNIFVMNADGSNPQQLTKLSGFNSYPAWSPDGKQITFTTNPFEEAFGWRIYIMNADGSDQKPLTDFSSADASWSPDGKQLVMNSDRDIPMPDIPEVYVVNADGSNPTRLTNLPPIPDASSRWSPDGKQIAFWSARDGNSEIYVMNADGSNVVRLTNDPGVDVFPAWSPDGKQIAFVSKRDGNYEIYVTLAPHASAGVNADGSNPVRLTNEPKMDSYPVWSPDGTRLAFVSNRGGSNDIYVMNADGLNVIRLTKSGFNTMPNWQP